MGCKEVIENNTYASELIREIQRQTVRYFIAIVISLTCNVFFVGYILYDRYMDSQVYVESVETTTTISQDGTGYNNYIDGNGEINNGSDNQESNNYDKK